MVQKTTVTYVDDLDDSVTDDVQSVTFAHEGRTYEIDLGAANREAFAELLGPYKTAGRRVGRAASSATTPARSKSSDLAKIRAWAAAQGIAVNERGRISASVREQYEAAQK
ncbi:hypothetical protein C8046_16700 [Serinibacter arcticus]|uniref:Histone protein Lsr2 n=1 Tax=Serinibacter arcticus TaxID=1655435 RepID=A0A2U1ZYH9_9MICO|nr:Lsr2 family protein [Serinibacter arcticus]PWD52039.1 hypothetical protein C8046_16700 [Serinibacter arcticus]